MKLLCIKEVAKRLSVSKRSVERLKKDGGLPPHVLVLGAHRWYEHEIEEYMRTLRRFDAPEVTR